MSGQPTPKTYAELQQAYTFFNDRLYQGRLPECLIVLDNRKRSKGYFSPHRYADQTGQLVHGLAMNPAFFSVQPLEETLSTLVHEMTHVWQFEEGQPGRGGYHNKQWASHMINLGLQPTHTGQLGGRLTGEQMTHYIVEGGAFIQYCRELLTTSFRLSFFERFIPDGLTLKATPDPVPTDATNSSAPPVATLSPSPIIPAGITQMQSARNRSNRQKYACPSCGAQVWGKPGLNLGCGGCQQTLINVT